MDSDVFMYIMVAYLILYALVVVIHRYQMRKMERRNSMDDNVDFDDWKNGSPNDPVPHNAKPFKTDL